MTGKGQQKVNGSFTDEGAQSAVAGELVISDLRKSFGGSEVLHGISLRVGSGEFVGLMGPNGAGKSTLIKILDGVYSRSSGDIIYDGRPVSDLGSLEAVGFIHQDLGLVEDLSIVDNLRLGERPMRRLGPILNSRLERQAAMRALARVDLAMPVDTLVADLSPGEKTLVAIARILERGARVVFVDEATSTLPPRESNRLIDALWQIVESGATVIMVSHKLSEILDSTHRVVVLLDGKITADVPASQLDRQKLVSMLVANESADGRKLFARPRSNSTDEELLRVEDLHGGRLKGVDFSLGAGEVVGLTGLPGSGLHDVAYLTAGRMRPSRGSIVLAPGAEASLVPPHRETQGGFLEQSVRENLTISALNRWLSPARVLKLAQERADAEEMISRLSVKPQNQDAQFGTLSGGNKQKVIFGRLLMGGARVNILCEPTRGVDVGTRMEIYRLILKAAENGNGILVVSSDSEDLFAICERIAVVKDGVLTPFVDAKDLDPRELEAFI